MHRLFVAFATVVAIGNTALCGETATDEIRYGQEKDISYLEDGKAATPYQIERCRLDLYRPENRTGFATVVWFHGGGLTGGRTVEVARVSNEKFWHVPPTRIPLSSVSFFIRRISSCRMVTHSTLVGGGSMAIE